MSEPHPPTDETVAEPVAEHDETAHDVVASAREGLDAAEAAGRDAVADAPAAREPASADGHVSVEPGANGGEPAPAAESAPEAPEPAYTADAYAVDAYTADPPAEARADRDAADHAEAALPRAEATPPVLASAEAPAAPSAGRLDDARAAAAPADGDVPWYDRPLADDGTPTVAVAGATVAEPAAVTASEPAAVVPPAPVAPAHQPIFVQAPEAPRPKGNRGAAGAIGLLAALSFAVLYLAAWLGIGLVQGKITGATLTSKLVDELTTWELWIPVVVFFIAFWLLGAIINRGRWGVWVVIGLLVGVASWGGHLLGQLFQAPFWMLTASQAATLVHGQLFAPLAVAAFIIGRELTVWFSGWVSARGKRVTELNLAAQHEYERTLEAGPQIVRP